MACILVTGASGALGRMVVTSLRARGHDVVRGLRQVEGEDSRALGDLSDMSDLAPHLDGIDVVVHTAAITSPQGLPKGEAQMRLFAVNQGGSFAVARAAAGRVKRVIHVSTIKVLGETSTTPLDETAPMAPFDAYAASKAAAEAVMIDELDGSTTELVILRPPLVYGPGDQGNFHTLARAVARGLPLPFARARNRRSLIYRGNLAHAVAEAITCPQGLYHLADPGPAISTATWVRRLAQAQGVKAHLVAMPPKLLRALLVTARKKPVAWRLLDDLELDVTKARAIFAPMPFEPDEAFALSLGARAKQG